MLGRLNLVGKDRVYTLRLSVVSPRRAETGLNPTEGKVDSRTKQKRLKSSDALFLFLLFYQVIYDSTQDYSDCKVMS